MAELKYSGSPLSVGLLRSANELAIGLPSPPRHSYGEPRPHGSSTKASCRIQRCHWWAWTETDSPTESSRTRLQKRTKQCHLVREKQGEIWAEEFPTRTLCWTSPGVRMTAFFFPSEKCPSVSHTFFLKKKHNGFFKKKKKHLLTFPSVWSISNRAIKTLKPFNMLFFLNDVGNVVLKMTLLGWKYIHFWNVCSIFEREALCTAQWFIEELLLQCSENSWRIIK